MRIVALLLTLLMAPSLLVRWTDEKGANVTLKFTGIEADVARCLTKGRESKVQFSIQLCRRRSGWFDKCVESRSEHHSAEYDTITESYRVVSDRFGDELEPVAVGVPQQHLAIEELLTVKAVPLGFLARDDQEMLNSEKAYVSAKATHECISIDNKTLRRLGTLFTFGLSDIGDSDTGWNDFDLHPPK